MDWILFLSHNGKVLVLAIAIDITVVLVIKNVCWMANRQLKLFVIFSCDILVHFDAMLEYLASFKWDHFKAEKSHCSLFIADSQHFSMCVSHS